MYDVVVIGGGPAGLSAALVLGRSRRSVLLLDAGHPRNERSAWAGGVFSRDGMHPAELLQVARRQLARYETVEVRRATAVAASIRADGFAVTAADGAIAAARRLLLAHGIVDRLPNVEGVAALWGRGIYHCPHCDGWEMRDKQLAVWADGPEAVELVPVLLPWSRDLVLLTGGPSRLSPDERRELERHGVRIVESRIRRIEGADRLERVVLDDGSSEEPAAVFLKPEPEPASDLAAQLGCELSEWGLIEVGADSQTSVPGVYAAGDAASKIHQVVVAAAAGARAAIALHHDLAREDFVARPAPRSG